jgi:hypothetical protein
VVHKYTVLYRKPEENIEVHFVADDEALVGLLAQWQTELEAVRGKYGEPNAEITLVLPIEVDETSCMLDFDHWPAWAVLVLPELCFEVRALLPLK